MRSNNILVIAALLLIAACFGPAYGQDLRFHGVLGNSGEQGTNLVKFGPPVGSRQACGMGVVCDRFGTLWDRSGVGTLNRYTLDGRMLGTYRIPQLAGGGDRLTSVGDTLVMLLRGRLFTMSIDRQFADRAAAGPSTNVTSASVVDLKVAAKIISTNAHQGKIAIISGESELSWLDVASGKSEALIKLPEQQIQELEVMSDGSILYYSENMVRLVVNGKVVTNEKWPRRIHGERESAPGGLQRLGDNWFAFAWHGTIKRYAADLTPAPGVVLGGGSGWVIGKVPANAELELPQGMARISDRLFAVSGFKGVAHLLHWNEQTGKMSIVRRIGAMQNVSGMAIDPQGRITIGLGKWEWDDAADSPISDAKGPEFSGQPAMLENGSLAAAISRWEGTRVGWMSGPLGVDNRSEDRSDYLPGGESPVSATAWRVGKSQRVLLINAKGIGTSVQVSSDGQLQKVLGGFRLEVGVAVKRWASIAVESDSCLLAAGDGEIYRFAASEDGFISQGRWSPSSSDEKTRFGGRIMIASDAGLLWVADTKRHRVLCFDLVSRNLVGQFGRTDTAGAGIDSLNSPTTIACRGARAVVFDSENQRVVKLSSK
jgi:hypothetical protein